MKICPPNRPNSTQFIGHRVCVLLLGGLVSSDKNHTVAIFVNSLCLLHTHADTTQPGTKGCLQPLYVGGVDHRGGGGALTAEFMNIDPVARSHSA